MLVLLGLMLVACGDNKIDENRDRWLQNRPSQYVVKVQATGAAGGCIIYGVSNGQVVAQQTQPITRGCFYGKAGDPDPLLAMFDVVKNEGDCDVSISYDS